VRSPAARPTICGVPRYRFVLLAALATFAGALAAPAATPPSDSLLVLGHRAGPYRYLDSFERGKPRAYAAALGAFGEPTRFHTNANFCRVTWAGSGITVGFASAPPGCSRANLSRAAWYGMSLHGSRWHNRWGIRVGDTVAKVRRFYPRARFARPLGTRWLVLVRRREAEFDFILLAVAVNRLGRVTSIEVPAGYVY
jgi:hypothetical protein